MLPLILTVLKRDSHRWYYTPFLTTVSIRDIPRLRAFPEPPSGLPGGPAPSPRWQSDPWGLGFRV